MFGAVLIHAAAAGVAVGVIALFPQNPAPVESAAAPSAELMVKLGEAVAAEEPLQSQPDATPEREDSPASSDATPAETVMEPAPATPAEPSPAPPLAQPLADSAPLSSPDGKVEISAEPEAAAEVKPAPVVTKPSVSDKPKLAAKPREKPAAPKTKTTTAPHAPATKARKPPTTGATGVAEGIARRPAAQAAGGYENAGTASYIRRGSVTYPAEAKRKRQAGSVRLMLYISAAGSVDRVEVVRSSGFPLLDAAAVRAESRSRLNPARRNGIAVPSRAVTECRFVLD